MPPLTPSRKRLIMCEKQKISVVEKFFVQKRLEETQTQSKITDSFRIDQLILK